MNYQILASNRDNSADLFFDSLFLKFTARTKKGLLINPMLNRGRKELLTTFEGNRCYLDRHSLSPNSQFTNSHHFSSITLLISKS